ncbi:hypothetical protein BJ546DRAFT_956075 [Cryomyces antarcticus]
MRVPPVVQCSHPLALGLLVLFAPAEFGQDFSSTSITSFRLPRDQWKQVATRRRGPCLAASISQVSGLHRQSQSKSTAVYRVPYENAPRVASVSVVGAFTPSSWNGTRHTDWDSLVIRTLHHRSMAGSLLAMRIQLVVSATHPEP